jgi:hypothetical protein
MSRKALVVVLGVILVAALVGGLVAARAQGESTLPTLTPEQLLTKVAEAGPKTTAVSGDFAWTNDLLGAGGLSLPTGDAGLASLLQSGNGRLWYQDGKVRLEVQGRSAHGATPWLGDNAVVKAVEVFRGIESLPFARHSSALFDRPSINLGRIMGGDALNKVPDTCVIDVDIRFLPDQDPDEILGQVSGLPDTRVLATFRRPPAVVEPDSPFVQGLCEAASPHHPERVMSVGRDGASDAVSFLAAGVPAVEFGPVGDGHHGPSEWVSISSLRSYRQALEGFVKSFPGMAAA